MKRFASDARVTIADVARLAAVSKTTVSHVLTGKRPVAPETRARVETAIEQLQYRPNGLARSLRTRTTHMVALVIPDITNPFYPLLHRGLEDGLDGDYRAFICSTDGRPEREREFLEDVADRRVDGVVVDSFTMPRHAAAVPVSIPVVRIGTTVVEDPDYDTVHSDDENGAYAATAHLVDKGHARVAMIQGPPGAGAARNAGYRRVLEERGLTVDPALVVASDWTRAGGTAAAERLLALPVPPTAIFCANDLMALGALDACRARSRDVPGDVAIVGYDDMEAAAMVSPPLTTVSNPAYETGFMAGVLLRERMTGAYRDAPRTVTLPCRLIERATS